MTKYVCGFMFNSDLTEVALIEKQKPVWQKGLLNGIGGKIEDSDIIGWYAMVREFYEETGLKTNTEQWLHLINLIGEDWSVEFYCGVESEKFEYIETKESEEVLKIPVDSLDHYPTIDNLQWLIPMSIYKLKNNNIRISK